MKTFEKNTLSICKGQWHNSYYSAFTYVNKFDIYHERTQTHPVLEKPLATAKTTAVKQSLLEKCNSDSTSTFKKRNRKKYKPEHLTSQKVGEIILESKI